MKLRVEQLGAMLVERADGDTCRMEAELNCRRRDSAVPGKLQCRVREAVESTRPALERTRSWPSLAK